MSILALKLKKWANFNASKSKVKIRKAIKYHSECLIMGDYNLSYNKN